jgi:hypothetical protein
MSVQVHEETDECVRFSVQWKSRSVDVVLCGMANHSHPSTSIVFNDEETKVVRKMFLDSEKNEATRELFFAILDLKRTFGGSLLERLPELELRGFLRKPVYSSSPSSRAASSARSGSPGTPSSPSLSERIKQRSATPSSPAEPPPASSSASTPSTGSSEDTATSSAAAASSGKPPSSSLAERLRARAAPSATRSAATPPASIT